MKNTATVARKCRITCDSKISIDLRAVIHDLQSFSIKRHPLIGTEPFGIHTVTEQTAERMSDQILQRQLFEFCQCLISISEDPVNRMIRFVEDHFNIGKCKWQLLKTSVMLPIFFFRLRDISIMQTADDIFPFLVKLLQNLFFLCNNVF